MNDCFRLTGFLLCAAASASLGAASASAGSMTSQQAATRQDPALVRQAAERFLFAQAAGLPGKITVEVGTVDNRLNLAACAEPQAFFAPGGRPWGKTTVGVRCVSPSPWTIYVGATVRVNGHYVAAAVPLGQGQLIQASDLALVEGELTALPAGIVTDPSQAVGRNALQSLAVGAPLRMDLLRAQPAVQQGQTVRLVSSGHGFRVSLEGRALSSGADGQTVQARTPSGQVVSGIARTGGVMEVSF